MATVFLAFDLRRDRNVALKVLRPELASTIGTERFLREIEISGKLNHPNILPLFDAGEADGVPFFVMPFVEGQTLRDLLRQEPQLGIEQALRIIVEVAEALSHAHTAGIIHRDIKPENILLSSGHALVADFGIARAIAAVEGANRLTETGMAIGTVDYMSPEQATGSERVDARSDLYSLACVLYEMLAGGPPFQAGTAQAVIARHLMDPVPPIRTVRHTVPIPVEAAILTALAKSKADRFASIQDFVEALDGRRDSPTPFLATTAAPRQRRKRVLLAAGLGALFVGVAGGYLVLRPPALDERRVLVAPFDDRTADASLAGLAAQASSEIVGGLASTAIVRPVDARSVATNAGTTGLPSLRRLARRLGANSVVSGTIVRQGGHLEFRVQLIDTETGGVLRPVRPVVASAVTPVGAVAEVAQRVMAGYAAHFDPQFRNYATASQPASYDAYREFQAGVLASQSDGDAALSHLRRAIMLDSTFMAPRVYVAASGSCRVADSVAAAFLAGAVRLLRSDQARVDLAQADCRGDRRAQLAAAQQLYADAPALAENVFLVSQAALYQNAPRDALTCLERLTRTQDPSAFFRSWCVNIMTHAHHQLGQYREALELIDRLPPDLAGDPLRERSQMRQWAALGNIAQIDALIGERLRKSSQVVLAGDDMRNVGEELRGHGHLAAGRSLCDRGVGWYRSRPASEQATKGARRALAAALYCAERWDEARVAYQSLAAEDTSGTGIEFLTRLGAIAARRNDTGDVRRIDQWFAARDTVARASYGRAVLAAYGGDRARALALFQFAWERRDPGFIEAHTDPALEPLRDYPPFLALLHVAR
ncbi:MAG: protein kinase domain-containing protein [Gemmatimonadales bacterium]